MCFIVRTNQSKQIAQEDIACFKVLEWDEDIPGYRSPYQFHHYPLGEMQHTEIEEPKPSATVYSPTINKGLHSYSYFEAAQSILWWDMDKRRVFNAIIPKGAEYYHDPLDGEYVSNQLKVTSKIE